MIQLSIAISIPSLSLLLPIIIIIFTATTTACTVVTAAFVTARTSTPTNIHNNNNNNNQISPWSSSEWRITFDFGKENYNVNNNNDDDIDTTTKRTMNNSNDDMNSWGISGARLGLSIDVLVESTTYPLDDDIKKERDFMGGSGTCNIMSVRTNATYITMDKGQQSIRFGPMGGWKLFSRRTGQPGDASVLRFWIDVLDTAIRNDICIHKDERLYGTTNCWREMDYNIGKQRIIPYEKRYNDIQNTILSRLDHNTGDRRLDGTDIIETTIGSIDMIRLLQQRDEALRELQSLQQKVPSSTSTSSTISLPGQWPGSNELLYIAQGMVGIQKRKRSSLFSLLGGQDEFHIIGTWIATPI